MAKQETERKYEVTSLDLPGWSQAIELDSRTEPDEEILHAVYFDTVDLALLRHGVTLRHRGGDEPAGWTLKLPADLDDTREEITVAGERDQVWLGQPPLRLIELVRAFTRGRQVELVATLSTRRRRTKLLDAAGNELAEVDDDLVSATPTGDETPTRWHEVEVELAGGNTATLDAVEHQLLEAGLRRSASPSKLATALADRLPRPSRQHKRPTAGGIVVKHLHEEADRLVRFDPRVRLQQPDAVHQMRVCCRRIRSTLQAYGQVLDPEHTAGLVAELRWLGEVLGAARDVEVLRARIADGLATLPAEVVGGQEPDDLDRFFVARIDDALTEVIAALDSDRYLDLLATLDALIETPPFTVAAWDRPRAVLPAALRASARRVERHIRASHDHNQDRDVELHEARKAAKRLRYAAEAATPALGRTARKLAGSARAIQDVLGERQDAVTARPILRELATTAATTGHDTFAYGALYQREADRVRTSEAQLPAAWQATLRHLLRIRRA